MEGVLFTSLFPYIYLGVPYYQGKKLKGDISYSMIVIVLPIYYYVMSKILNGVGDITEGMITGFVLSLIGRFYYDAPKRLFEMENEKLVHIYATIMYGIIFYVKKMLI